MKNLFLLFALFSMTSFFLSCDDDDDSEITTPDVIESYVMNNFSGYEIEDIDEETLCVGTAVYEVDIENEAEDDLELVFDMEGNFLFSETEIELSQLPEAVSNAISTEYPDHVLEEAEKRDLSNGDVQYKVELEGNIDLEVLFDSEGEVICEEEE